MALLFGTASSEQIDGTGAADIISALAGNDIVVGGAGADTIDGGTGNDTLYAAGSADWRDGAVDTVRGGAGDDRVFAAYGDTLSGGSGFDRLSLDLSGADAGIEVDFRPMTLGVELDLLGLVSVAVRLGQVDLDGFEAIEQVVGSAFDDNVTVGNRGRVASILDGGAGNDVLNAGNGADTINGGSGADRMRGGGGDDQYLVDDARDRVIEKDGGGRDTVTASVDHELAEFVENLNLTGAARVGRGNALDNRISGGDSDEKLFGFDGADILVGGAGEDSLNGGAGRDRLTGGAGADLFVFADGDTPAAEGAHDLVNDFSQADGDRLSLHRIDAVRGGEDDVFAFIGEGPFTGAAGELRFAHVGGNTFVYGDTDGDLLPDIAIQLRGNIDLTVADFAL